MNVYEVRHEGHYLGGLSIVVAESKERALALTRAAIAEHGLHTDNISVHRKLSLDYEHCYVLNDGDY